MATIPNIIPIDTLIEHLKGDKPYDKTGTIRLYEALKRLSEGLVTTINQINSGNIQTGPAGADGSDAIPVLLPNHVENINLSPTGTVTTLSTIPSTAFVYAPSYVRNEGTAGNWLISFGGLTPTNSSYSVKIGPGDSSLLTLGEAYKEANTPIGTIKAFHDNPGAGGAGKLTGFVAWNDGTSPLAGPTGPQGPYGGPITIDYRFDTAIGNVDPGVGYCRLNNVTENIATALYINTTS